MRKWIFGIALAIGIASASAQSPLTTLGVGAGYSGGPSPGGFPVVEATNTGAQSAANPQPIALPAGIVAGNMLLACVSLGGTGGQTITPPGDWATLVNVGTGGVKKTYVGYKIAAGGDTLTLTFSSTASVAYTTYRISNIHISGAIEATSQAGNDANPAPPNLAPSWGAGDTLWIACAEAASAISGFPSGYGNPISDATGTAATGSAELQLNASNETPGTFTASSGIWRAQTIGIRGP